jgi:hypothetical protein
MDRLAQPRNPLWFVALAFLITLPFDFYWYIAQRLLIGFGVLVIIGKLLFLLAYFRKSRFAWHIGLIVIAAITPLSLVLIHFGSEPGEHPHSHPVFEIAIVLILIAYLWKIRGKYAQYVGPESKQSFRPTAGRSDE